MAYIQIISVFFIGSLLSCASVTTEHNSSDDSFITDSSKSPDAYPGYDGPRKRIQVVRFGIPADVAQKYPELAEKKVGFGLCNRIVESLWDTGRFEFIEDKSEILDRMVQQWEMSAAGLVAEETAVEAGNLKAPEYLVYAEVYEFSINRSEKVAGLKVKGAIKTLFGIQIRMVDVTTGQFYPASAIGEADSQESGAWATVDLEFDESSVGKASQDAVSKALVKLFKRLPN